MTNLFDLAAIGAGLPVADAEAKLRAALGEAGAALVVTAPPGSGKTTFVPPLVANLVAEEARRGADGAPSPGRVILTQPRRVAVRAAARRIAHLDGSQLGGPVGMTVRGERKVSAQTRLEVVTPGVLLRRLLADPALEGVAAVVLDEVHERSLESDLLLGMLAEVRELRGDLTLVAMSATLDAGRFAALLGGGGAGDATRGGATETGTAGGRGATGAGAAPLSNADTDGAATAWDGGDGADGAAASKADGAAGVVVREAGGVAIVDVPSALHPLEVEYAPPAAPRLDARGVTRDFLGHVARVTADAHLRTGHDALVFVPGALEVDEVVARLRGLLDPAEHEVLALQGRLSAAAQDRAVSGRGEGDPARIVVSTALAESSLTVPGVRLVVDTGLSREVRRDRGRDMSGLVTVSASRASAEQRAGRAARQGPGVAVRAYAETDFARMTASSTPEIVAADLTDAALLLAAWGTPRGEGLALLDAPPELEIRAAQATLAALELVDGAGAITNLGRTVARMPVGVREARALVRGAELGGAELGGAGGTANGARGDGARRSAANRSSTGARTSANPASGRSPGVTNAARLAAEVVAAVSDDYRADGADVTRLIRDLRGGRHPGAGRWKREANRLSRLTEKTAARREINGPAGRSEPEVALVERAAAGTGAAGSGTVGSTETATSNLTAGVVLALGRPEWIARCVSPGGKSGGEQRGTGPGTQRGGQQTDAALTYLFASGTRAALPPGSSLVGHEWLAVWEVQRAGGKAAQGTGAIIRAAAPLTEEEALALAGPQLRVERAATIADDGAVRVREERRLGEIVLASTPVLATADDAGPALLAHVRQIGVDALPWSTAGEALRDRLALLHRELGAPWPDVGAGALAERLDEWLAPDLLGGRVKSLAGVDLASALRRLLPWPEAAQLEELAPERLEVPSGSRPRVDYSPVRRGEDPVVAVKLQEMFGLADTPHLVGGRVGVVVHLLSPAGRPLAVTSDLRSFWDGPYQEVRREMRGRYAKHPWPEDPWTAEATRRVAHPRRR